MRKGANVREIMKTNNIFSNYSSYSRIVLAFILLFFTIIGASAFAPNKDLTNQQTYELMQQDRLILIDIRTKAEWQQTGIAKGALTIDMMDKDFLEKIANIRLDNPAKTIAFICASGRRSSIVWAELTKRGYKNIYSVFGGTTGNGVAGWIKDGLPIEKYSAN